MNPSPARSPKRDPAKKAGRADLRALARLLARIAAEKDYRCLVGGEAEPCDRAPKELTHD